MKTIIRYLTIGVLGFSVALSGCQPPQEEDNHINNDVSSVQMESKNLDFDSTMETQRNTVAPDVIYIEGFGNFMHTSNDNSGSSIIQTVLNFFINTVTSITGSTSSDSQLEMAKLYWGVYKLNFNPSISKEAHLHWDSGYRFDAIGREFTSIAGNKFNATQLYDNYDCVESYMGATNSSQDSAIDVCSSGTYNSGTKGLITRLKNLMENQDTRVGQSGTFCGDTNGCIFITHSTGGGVADVLLAELYKHRTEAAYMVNGKSMWERINFSLEIASASGGTGLASWIIDTIANHGTIDLIVTQVTCSDTEPLIRLLFSQFRCGQPGSEGAGYNLIPDNARRATLSGNQQNDGRTPVLHVAGNGHILWLDLSLLGFSIYEGDPVIVDHLNSYEKSANRNDGLVGLHSACGYNNTYEVTNCVAGYGLYTNHHPFILTEEGHLSQVIPGATMKSIGGNEYLSTVGWVPTSSNYTKAVTTDDDSSTDAKNSANNSALTSTPTSAGTYNLQVRNTVSASLATKTGSKCINKFIVCLDYEYYWNVNGTLSGTNRISNDDQNLPKVLQSMDLLMERGDAGEMTVQ
ncbi:MAG: hypothetical protein HQM11_17905 [SAR324 cluster bacterium]|nr:hypothetical protein [SAR324 cluster bacterium]